MQRAGAGIASLALFVLSASGCGSDKKPAGLAVIIESDLSLPKDIDRISFDVSQGPRVLRSEQFDVGAMGMLIPAELKLEPVGNDDPVTIRIVGYKNLQPRIERSAITAIPASFVGMLRMPLNYLCAGTADSAGLSSCGDGMTCKQGTCASSTVAAMDLPRYLAGPWTGAESGKRDPAQNDCFDVLSCFTSASRVTLDRESCSFTLEQDDPGHISVGIKLPPGSDGICGAGSCWVALDEGPEGWAKNGLVFSLPPSLCRGQSDGSSFTVVASNMCGAKVVNTPPCGDWSSATRPADTSESIGPPNNMPMETPGDPIGPACAGPSFQPCGDCGQQRRVCRNGVWGEWGACSGQGLCDPNQGEMCGLNGNRICLSMCEWGECTGETCAGPAVEACGKCGTRRRTCLDGEWGEWSACSDEGDCSPGQTAMCGTNGTQGCMGNCRWGACGEQACPGAPSQACGNCGTQTRTCDAATATWSAWGPCEQEGICEANQTRACGLMGMQVCGGLCQWDPTCTNQVCEGPASQPCGNCGVQTRVCDNVTGIWGAWGACGNEGVCVPGNTQACGAMGTQTCLDSCQWAEECAGQVCEGPTTESCGFCGTRSRTCNAATGQWSDWGACNTQGPCNPGSTRSCGVGGTQTCTAQCGWPDECTGQSCVDGPSTRACGNCGTQTRTCNGSTGQWSDWSACTGQGACAPNATEMCTTGSQRACSSTCQWGDCECLAGFMNCDGVCVDLETDSLNCGACNVSCNGLACNDGVCATCQGNEHICNNECVSDSSLTACGNDDGECTACPAAAPESVMECINGGCEQRCVGSNVGDCPNCGTRSRTCMPNGAWSPWGDCVPAQLSRTCGDCQSGEERRTCSNGDLSGYGPCMGAVDCPSNGVCMGMACVCPSGQHQCGDACEADTDPNNCGPNCIDCPSPNGVAAVCMNGTCSVNCPGAGMTYCATQNVCANLLNDVNNCGDCGTVCPVLEGGNRSCVSGDCVSNCDDNELECGGACRACSGPSNGTAACNGNACVRTCSGNLRDCAGTCVACTGPTGGAEQCNGGACVRVCSPTQLACGGACVTCEGPTGGDPQCDGNACVRECGTGELECAGACDACTGPTGGTPQCNGNQCERLCTGGQVECGGACVTCTGPDGGDPMCNGNQCVLECGENELECGGACRTCSDGTGEPRCDGNQCVRGCADGQLECGNQCRACTGPANGTPTCDGNACVRTCGEGQRECGGRCVSCTGPTGGTAECNDNDQCVRVCDENELECGGACRTCTGSSGEPRCDGNACVRGCDDGQLECGGACRTCTGPSDGTAQCNGNACVRLCANGELNCGGMCDACTGPSNGAATCNDDNQCVRECGATEEECGGMCTTCSGPSNGTPECNGTQCARECGATEEECGGRCITACANGRECNEGSGTCQCPTGRAACGNVCCALGEDCIDDQCIDPGMGEGGGMSEAGEGGAGGEGGEGGAGEGGAGAGGEGGGGEGGAGEGGAGAGGEGGGGEGGAGEGEGEGSEDDDILF